MFLYRGFLHNDHAVVSPKTPLPMIRIDEGTCVESKDGMTPSYQKLQKEETIYNEDDRMKN